MSNLRCIGLDVHKESIVMAVAEPGDRPAEIFERLPYDPQLVLKRLSKLGARQSLRVCYEAGPTGYGLYRRLTRAGLDCRVVAPALVPQVSGTRVKTDRRDARKLAHFLRSGDLTTIWVPDEATEAIRDLERARDDARLAQRRIRQQLLKFLLRNERRFPGRTHWTKTHWQWIRSQRFEQPAQQRVIEDAIRTAEQADERVRRLDEDILECLPGWQRAPLVRDLQAFHGIARLSAVGLAAEIGDFRRFGSAGGFMSFVGLVPSEHSSGQSRRLGGITKTGNRHVRRLLIEAAWNYMGARAAIGPSLAKRREGVPEEIVDIADRALRRLRKTGHRLYQRKKASTKIAVSVARELAGFVWSAACTSDRLSGLTT